MHLLCAAVKRQRSTWQRYRDDLELHHSEHRHTHKTQVTWHVDTEGHTHECSDKSICISLLGRYQVPDVVFPKHGPTFCPRLWSSTMLARGGTRGSTVRGNVVINSTVPRRWDTAKRFRPASPAVALENHQYDRPMDLPPKPEILSEIRGCCVPWCTTKKKGGGGGEEARGHSTVRGAPQNGDGRVEADFAIMLSRVTNLFFSNAAPKILEKAENAQKKIKKSDPKSPGLP